MARTGRPRLPFSADSLIMSRARCRSSVVEHSLGKGEVVSSILPGSTISAHEARVFRPTSRQSLPPTRHRSAFLGTKSGGNVGDCLEQLPFLKPIKFFVRVLEIDKARDFPPRRSVCLILPAR